MSMPAKEGKFMNFKLDLKIVEQLEQYSKETMIPKTRIVEKALQEYFDRQPLPKQNRENISWYIKKKYKTYSQ